MPDISVAGELASCGHAQTGSSKVTIQGAGVSRVEIDTAGGLIIGPGSQNVFVEGFKVSLKGDAITSHGKTPHSASVTSAVPLNTTTTAGTGFARDTVSTGDAPKPNVVMEGWTSNYGAGTVELHASGAGVFPPNDMMAAWRQCNVGPNNPGSLPDLTTPPRLRYNYTISNRGADTSQEFSVGFWRFADGLNAPDQAILTLASQPYYPTAILEGEARVPALAPGQQVTGYFEWSGLYEAGRSYAFAPYADIYGEATEPDEKNSAPTIYVTVDNECS